jgi:DNA-binding transcriptional LysR family regulator
VSRWIAGRQFDLGLASLPVDYPGVASRRILSTRAVVALPRGHRLVRQRKVSIQDLAAESLIGLGADAMIQSKINRLFARIGRAPRLTVDTSSLLAVCHFVAAGLGCGIVDPFTAYAARSSAIAFRTLEPRLTLDYGILSERDQPLSEQLQALCEEIAAAALRLARAFDALVAPPGSHPRSVGADAATASD